MLGKIVKVRDNTCNNAAGGGANNNIKTERTEPDEVEDTLYTNNDLKRE